MADLSNRLAVADLLLKRLRKALAELGPIRVERDTLFAGHTVLNENLELLESVRGATNFGCTIFLWNVRIATTARARGQPGVALGSAANEEVTQQVLVDGDSFRGVTHTIGRDWVIVYEPLDDAGGIRVGMLAAYRELVDFDATD